MSDGVVLHGAVDLNAIPGDPGSQSGVVKRLHDSFFSSLPPFDDFVEVVTASHYRAVPADWLVVITDVRGSTKAIEEGRYKDVNSLGVASIVALRNALVDVDLPFVFGGDGATLLVPASTRERVEATLRGVKALAHNAFGMQMRTAIVSVAEIEDAGHSILVARFRASADVHLAMFRGTGLGYAERLVKDPATADRYAVREDGPSDADFTGFECRWEPIPSSRGVVASLLIQARAVTAHDADIIYGEVLAELDTLLESAGCPVSPETLQLQGLSGNFDAEARVRSGRDRGLGFRWRRFRAMADAVVGSVLLHRGWRAGGFPGDVYKEQVVANTDFRKFDETIRLVVDVSAETLDQIRAKLEARRARGDIAYGIHQSEASIMTCAIQAYEGRHMHFVDGADGGYALAAKQLKSQLTLSSASRREGRGP